MVLLAAGSGIRDTQVTFCINLLFVYVIAFVSLRHVFFFLQCGFKMFTRAAARRLFTNIHLKRYCIMLR